MRDPADRPEAAAAIPGAEQTTGKIASPESPEAPPSEAPSRASPSGAVPLGGACSPLGWLLTTRGQHLGALLAYVAASILLFGIPVVAHPTGAFVGWGTDPPSFMWHLSWWPHALGQGVNPLYTHDVWAPTGFNLTHATGIPGPALVMTPLTLVFGAIVAYNVLALLAPALAAWTAYLLCRHLTGSFWPSLVGGYLFGFSMYVLGQMLGHLNLSLVFLVPVAALLVVKRSAREITALRFVTLLTLTLVAEFLISLEVFMTLSLFGALTLGLALLIFRGERRRGVGRAAIEALAAYAIMAVVVSPYLISFLRDSNHAPIYEFYPSVYVTDLANFVVPTALSRIGGDAFSGVSQRFTGDISEQAAYFGLPLLAMVVLFAVKRRPFRSTWVVVGAFALACLASLGPRLHIAGSDTIVMPWKLALSIPLVKYALPARFLMFAWLAAAVMAAWWLASERARWRWLLATVAVVALLPNTSGPFWHTTLQNPPFFADGLYRRVLPPGTNTLVVPYGSNGDSMLWQAETGFAFRMPGGNVGVRPPPEFGQWPITDALYSGQIQPGSKQQLRRFIAAKDVGAIVVVDGTPGPWGQLFSTVDGSPQHLGGVTVYQVPRPAGP
jgi:hypothetical protein